MRSKTDILLVTSFTMLILGIIFVAQGGIEQITGFTAGNAEVCIGQTPVLVSMGNLTAYTWTLFDYDVNHTITNNETTNYTDTASFFTIDETTGVITFTPQEEDVGNYTVMIIINNSECPELGDLEELNFEIILDNSAPILEIIENYTVWEDDLLTIDVDATDPDGDNITYACNTSLFTINETTGIIEWTPTNDHVGLHWFDCNATDDYGAYDSQIFFVQVRNVNDIPILDVISNFTVENETELYEDQAFEYDVNATDPDGDTIEYLDNTSLFVISSRTGDIAFTPTHSKVGNHSVEIYATDNIGPGIAQQVVLFEILEVNDPPELDLIGAQTAKSKSAFYLDVNATDEEDGSDNLEGTGNLTFEINDTSLFNINSTTGVISFTPSNSDIGNYSFNISVTDGGVPAYGLGSAMDSEVISFVVTEANNPPNITSYEPEDLTPTLTVGECLQFNVTVTDPDGGTPTVKWYLDEIFTNETGNSYNYCPSSTGVYNITALATDGEDDDLQEWTATVQPAPLAPGFGAVSGAGTSGKYACKELWICTDWSTCMINDLQIRTCKDIKECGTTSYKPPELRVCIFVPRETCFDGIRNQNEILPDCGGVCLPCPTCNDGICNQGEQCEICDEDPRRCPRDLDDNILSDCGGPCPLCPKIEKPLRPEKVGWKTTVINITKITLGAILILLVFLVIFVKIVRKLSKKAILTEQEKSEIMLLHKIDKMVEDAEKAIDMRNMNRLNTTCAKIEKLYNQLSSTKNKKKVYPQIKKLKRAIKIGF